MPINPNAVWDPVADRDKITIVPVRMVLHSAVVDSADLYGPQRGQGRTYSHFYAPGQTRLRQHQDTGLMARADLHGNRSSVSQESWDGRREQPWTASQVEETAENFVWLTKTHPDSVPFRMADWKDTRGLAWHRLGILGNFGKFDPKNILTWSGAQTGERWSNAYGKLCPWDVRILQVPEIFSLAKARHDRLVLPLKPLKKEKKLTPEERERLLKVQAKTDEAHWAIVKSIQPAVARIEKRTYGTEAKVTALQGAVKALADNRGASTEKIDALIETSVKEALKNLEVTLSVGEEDCCG